jgi:hypothetical protein
MKQTDRNQALLNWLENEKKKDEIQEKNYKDKLIREIKKLEKEQIFPKKKKLTIWQKLKKIILGI